MWASVLEVLCNDVMEAQARGWEPLGGVAVASFPDGSECWYQAIVNKKAFTREEIRKQLGV